MSVKIYMDVNVPYAIAAELRLRSIDVVTAQEDGAAQFSDANLLSRATEQGRILFSFDHDLLREATLRQQRGEIFAGLIYAHQPDVSIGECVMDLELIAQASESREWINRVEFLPLR